MRGMMLAGPYDLLSGLAAMSASPQQDPSKAVSSPVPRVLSPHSRTLREYDILEAIGVRMTAHYLISKIASTSTAAPVGSWANPRALRAW